MKLMHMAGCANGGHPGATGKGGLLSSAASPQAGQPSLPLRQYPLPGASGS